MDATRRGLRPRHVGPLSPRLSRAILVTMQATVTRTGAPRSSLPATSVGGVPLHLAQLYRKQLLASQDRKGSYDAVSGELCDYTLLWRGGAVDVQVYGVESHGLSILSVGYGDEVIVFPELYSDFLLVHASLRGAMEIDADGTRLTVPQGSVCINSPRRRIRLRWQEGSEQLIVRIPRALLGRSERSARSGTSATLLSPVLASAFAHQLNALLALSPDHGNDHKDRLWQSQLSRAMAEFAVAQLGGGPPRHVPLGAVTRRNDATPSRPYGVSGRDRCAPGDLLERFISEHLHEPLRLIDLARALGVSRSRLNEISHEAYGSSPMLLVRRRRLDAVRRAIEADPTEELTVLCGRFGIEHLGRFAHYYRAQFGELPSQTRARLR